MANDYTPLGFSAVDQSGRSGQLIGQLVNFSGLAAVRAYKARSFELLCPRSGGKFLDLGCGVGEDVLTLAQQVGSDGLVIGVDRSEAMLDEARQRARGLNLPVDFRQGDAYALEFANAIFDGCRADRVFHHLDNPRQALAELVRVTRPGGRIVLSEPDFETVLVDSPDRPMTRKLMNLFCDSCANGWIGRQLQALFLEVGLADVEVQPIPFVFTDYATANLVLCLERTTIQAQEAGSVTSGEVETWLGQLKEADRAGRFYAMLVGFLAWGRKPRE